MAGSTLRASALAGLASASRELEPAAQRSGGLVDTSVLLVALAPALLMLLGSIAVFFVRVPEKLQACTQNFSAGILLAAVAGELFPLLDTSDDTAKVMDRYIGLCGGFFVALIFMFGLEYLTEDCDEVSSPQPVQPTLDRNQSEASCQSQPVPDNAAQVLEAFAKDSEALQSEVRRLADGLREHSLEDIDSIVHGLQYHADRARRRLAPPESLDEERTNRLRGQVEALRADAEKLQSQTCVVAARRALRAFERSLQDVHLQTERPKFRRWHPEPMPSSRSFKEKISWPLVGAVTADAVVDGLLIGLAFTASLSSGRLMAIATSIEMCFLGLAFSASVQNFTHSLAKHVLLVSLPPLLLAVAAVSGRSLGELLTGRPMLFVGFISFAIVALLFLVTQELLTEARKVAGDSICVNLMLFGGVLAGIVLESVLE